MVVNIVDVGWATSKSGCLPISDHSSHATVYNAGILASWEPEGQGSQATIQVYLVDLGPEFPSYCQGSITSMDQGIDLKPQSGF
jgi:hypothetical protein